MYELIIPNKVKKDLKKLEKPVIKEVLHLFDEIAENPFIGSHLKAELSSLYKLEFRKQGISYRLAYEIFQQEIQVQVIHVGTRENFYDELKRRR
jgi:mRNA-degrading endonuclease RelE of RelBE toxin-antitoxin system